jgi:hypothetical protein
VSRYLRALCTGDPPPTLRELLADVEARGTAFALDPAGPPVALDDPAWREATLLHGQPAVPFPVELNRAGDPPEDDEELDLVGSEIEELLEELEDAPANAARRKVEAHLRATRFIVAVQILSSFDDASFAALGDLVRSLMERHGALIQADGEGFYEGDRVIVRTS